MPQVFYIYIGHGTYDGVLILNSGSDGFWNLDISSECPLSFDLIHPLGNFSRLSLDLSIDDICEKMNKLFQFVEVIQYDQMPTYCKHYIPPLKKFSPKEIKECYPELKILVKLEEYEFNKFIKLFEKNFGRYKQEDVNEIIKTMWESLNQFQYFGYYRDFVKFLESKFKIP